MAIYKEVFYGVCFDDNTLLFDGYHYGVQPTHLEVYAYSSRDEANRH